MKHFNLLQTSIEMIEKFWVGTGLKFREAEELPNEAEEADIGLG